MVFPQAIAAFHAVFNIIALPGNLLVIATVILESSRGFYVKRYILLASLALSHWLMLILVFNSHSASELQRKKIGYMVKLCAMVILTLAPDTRHARS